jgi:radical SAM-linked protein
MRFASHRDIARAVERGVRKAGLPIAYSAGFTPHPKISYAGAAATGVASEAEYLELAFTSPCTPEDVRARLDAALPDGIDVIDVAERGSELPLARLEASQWQVTLPGVLPAAAEAAISAFLASSRVEVERDMKKKGTRRMDARAAVISMELDRRADSAQPGECGMLRMVVRHTTPAVRPDDILVALHVVADSSVAGLTPSAPPLITRLAQVPLEGAAVPAGPGTDIPAAAADRGRET